MRFTSRLRCSSGPDGRTTLRPTRCATFHPARGSTSACRTAAPARFSSRSFPDLSRGRRKLTRPLGFAFSFLQSFACTLQLFLGNAHSLLGDLGLQPRTFNRFRLGLLRGRRPSRWIFAACFLHVDTQANGASLTHARMGCHRSGDAFAPLTMTAACHLSTERVHKCVDSRGFREQRRKRGNDLRQCARSFARWNEASRENESGIAGRGRQHRGCYPVASAVLTAV